MDTLTQTQGGHFYADSGWTLRKARVDTFTQTQGGHFDANSGWTLLCKLRGLLGLPDTDLGRGRPLWWSGLVIQVVYACITPLYLILEWLHMCCNACALYMHGHTHPAWSDFFRSGHSICCPWAFFVHRVSRHVCRCGKRLRS